jgi:hypothetical protein
MLLSLTKMVYMLPSFQKSEEHQAMNCLTETSVTQRFSSVSKQLRQKSPQLSLRRMGPTCLLCRTRFCAADRSTGHRLD